MKQIALTPLELKIYEIMRNSIKHKHKAKVSDIANQAGTVPSNVIKLTKKLGYVGWNEMYYTLSNNNTDVISLSFRNFDFLTNDEVNHYIKVLCRLLKQNHDGKCFVSAIGDAEIASQYLSCKLLERGFTAVPIDINMINIENRDGTPGIVFAINESGIALLECCIKAKENQYHVVSITGNSHSPLAMHSHVTIELKNHKSSLREYSPNFFIARVIILIELLFAVYDES